MQSAEWQDIEGSQFKQRSLANDGFDLVYQPDAGLVIEQMRRILPYLVVDCF